jgi:signal transduction histidine kinase
VVLGALPVTFFLIAPLGLVGFALATRDWRRTWPLLSLVLWIVGILMIFLVLGRLRDVLVAAMIPLAALTIVRLVGSPHRWRIAAVVVAIAFWTDRPLPATQPLISVTDWFTPYWVTYGEQVRAFTSKGDAGGAAQVLEAFFQYEPDFSQMDRSNGQLVDAGDRDAARAFARVHAERAELLEQSGQALQAESERVRSASLVRLSGTPIDR